MEKVKLGVVGLGWVAQVIHLPILTKLADAEVVSVCDRDRSKARLVAEKFGVKRVYYDVQQMLENEDIGAVIIATSTDAHKDTAIACLKAGKDVLVEKPIARTYNEAVAVAEAARESKRKLMVGMNHRFRPDTMILKSFIEADELGKVFYTRAGWLKKRTTDSAWATQKEKSGGGVFLDLGIVILDMALWMMGYPDVKRVSALEFKHKTRQVEDTSLVAINLKNGSRIQIEVSWAMCVEDDVYFCHVFGTDGSASLNPLRINKELNGTVANLAPAKIEAPQHLFKRSYENELKHFIGAVRNLHPVISPADEAVQRMKIVEAIYKSSRLGKEVSLP
jgi:predicted dehydrogenase